MQLYPSEHFITGDRLLYEYDAEVRHFSIVSVAHISILCPLLPPIYSLAIFYIQLIKQCQDELVPEKANILLYSKSFGKDGVCDMEEEWFHTKYCVEGNLTEIYLFIYFRIKHFKIFNIHLIYFVDVPEEWMQTWQSK